jgi:integrase
MTTQGPHYLLPADELRSVGMTLADVIDLLSHDADLSVTRKRDLISALRRVCEMVGLDPAQVPAEPAALRAALARIHPVQYGISRKTYANLRTNAFAAIRHTAGFRVRIRLTPPWQSLFELLTEKDQRYGLSRLAHFCSAHAVSPDAVDDKVMADFRAHLDHTLVPNPNDLHRRTCRLWNTVAETDSSLNAVVIPDYRPQRKRLALCDFAASFSADVEAYLAARANPDPFDDKALRRLKPRTVVHVRDQLRVAASALVASGRAPETVCNIGDLTNAEAVKAILRQLLEEHENRPNAWTEGIATALITAAREWVKLDQETLAELRSLRRKLPKRELGLTAKNRKTMRVLDDPTNLARLLHLPQEEFAEARRNKPVTHSAAVKAQVAFGIELLLACPIRSGNLIELTIDRHVLRPAGPHGKVYLSLEPEEVKNNERIDFELPPWLVEMLDIYVRDFLPIIGGPNCRHLFCVAGGVRKAQPTLAQQIRETIFDRIGLRISIHQFRHLAAKLYLDANPGAILVVSKLLGHKDPKTTMNSYAEFNTRRAGKLHDEIIQRRRAELVGNLNRRSRRQR